MKQTSMHGILSPVPLFLFLTMPSYALQGPGAGANVCQTMDRPTLRLIRQQPTRFTHHPKLVYTPHNGSFSNLRARLNQPNRKHITHWAECTYVHIRTSHIGPNIRTCVYAHHTLGQIYVLAYTHITHRAKYTYVYVGVGLPVIERNECSAT
eukprot:jgi/Botrbrau1/7862/Bobra.9_2s0038.1